MNSTLMQELQESGVDMDHVAKMDQEKPLSLARFESYYDFIEEDETYKLVDVKKLKGLTDSRLDVNCTWLEHFNGKAGVLADNRIENLLNKLKVNGYSSFVHSFQKPIYGVPLAYFDKEDIYIAYGDGNHRTVFAKIVNAPYIYARVSYYRYNSESEHNYLLYQKLLKELYKKIKEFGFSIENNSVVYKGVIVIMNIPGYYRFDFNSEDMYLIQNRINIVQQQLDFIWEKNRSFKYLNFKWKIRICKLLENFGTDYDKQLLYGVLACLYEEGYVLN